MTEIDGNRAGMPVERKGRECLGEKAPALPKGTHPLAPSLPLRGRGKEGEKGRQRVRRESVPAPRQARGATGSITDGQKAAIWTMVRKNGMDEGDFREWLKKEFGTGSTKALSLDEAAQVIHHLKVFFGQEYEPYRGLTWGITRAQIGKIKRMVRDMGWVTSTGSVTGEAKIDEKRLNGMIKKMFPPKARIELLNKREGTSLIIALEKIGKDGKSDE